MIKIIEKYDQTFHFIEDSSSLEEIFNDNYRIFDKNITFDESDIIIDVGANIGAFSILFAKLYPFIKVYAVEPVAETYIKLCQNIKLSQLPPAKAGGL